MKKIATLLTTFLLISNSIAQTLDSYTFGEVTKDEIDLKIYEKDTLANAVVLFEMGSTIFSIKKDKIIISTTFYKKIKIFNTNGFEHGTFSIKLYKTNNDKEEVIDIKAITHNGFSKTFLNKSQIFNDKLTDNLNEVKFTMPNLKEGSIIEVEYTVNSPFKFNLTGWKFQSSIPKVYSIYKASIPGNYYYNRILTGYLKLDVNSSNIKKDCFRVPEYANSANCENVTYAIKDIPAFTPEDYMTNEENFVSKIKFELADFIWFDGRKQKYTTTWEAVDREFKTDKNIGGQFKKTKFFKDKLPPEIDTITSELNKAKAIYNFIQSYYTWNNKYNIFKDIDIKEGYKTKIGNVGEINISLINSLKAADINCDLVLISTRENGFPTKLHPVISDFNYIIAKTTINNTTYFLDATDKFTPFGTLPFRCLNKDGRVMDFENDSYWTDIIPIENSKSQLNVDLKLDENGTITGKIKKLSFGYDAISERKKIDNRSIEYLMSDFEKDFNKLEVTDYKIENKDNLNEPLIQIIDIVIENKTNATTHLINPYFTEQFKQNPFKQHKRLYPVDFGHPKKYVVNFMLEIPENYKIESFPNNVTISLPGNGGNFIHTTKKINNSKLGLFSTITIDKAIYYNSDYEFLQEYFKQIIITQKQLISLKMI